jgi:hypothetical protein
MFGKSNCWRNHAQDSYTWKISVKISYLIEVKNILKLNTPNLDIGEVNFIYENN